MPLRGAVRGRKRLKTRNVGKLSKEGRGRASDRDCIPGSLSELEPSVHFHGTVSVTTRRVRVVLVGSQRNIGKAPKSRRALQFLQRQPTPLLSSKQLCRRSGISDPW